MSDHVVVACDWDGTLVDLQQNWLPDALEQLKRLRKRGIIMFIHSSRANTDWGRDMIRRKLDTEGLHAVGIRPKPEADIYLDNKGMRFTGDWQETARTILT